MQLWRARTFNSLYWIHQELSKLSTDYDKRSFNSLYWIPRAPSFDICSQYSFFQFFVLDSVSLSFQPPRFPPGLFQFFVLDSTEAGVSGIIFESYLLSILCIGFAPLVAFTPVPPQLSFNSLYWIRRPVDLFIYLFFYIHPLSILCIGFINIPDLNIGDATVSGALFKAILQFVIPITIIISALKDMGVDIW